MQAERAQEKNCTWIFDFIKDNQSHPSEAKLITKPSRETALPTIQNSFTTSENSAYGGEEFGKHFQNHAILFTLAHTTKESHQDLLKSLGS